MSSDSQSTLYVLYITQREFTASALFTLWPNAQARALLQSLDSTSFIRRFFFSLIFFWTCSLKWHKPEDPRQRGVRKSPWRCADALMKFGAPNTWMWRARYMNVALQIHECGAPVTWMWRARYMNVALQLHESGVPIILFFTCSLCSPSSLAACHVLGKPNTWMRHIRYMNVAHQIHECGAPDTWMWRARYMNVARQIHECVAPDTWMWRTRYMIVAHQIHECGAPDTWMWRSSYMNLACQLF